MNIKERQQTLSIMMDARRFIHPDPSKNYPKKKQEKFKEDHGRLRITTQDWGSMIKPPLSAYLPPEVFERLYGLSTNLKLLSNPIEKFRMMEDLLRPYRFRILASGTNRRTFYCEYDPAIVLKVGSDAVGRADNIAEYNLQNTIRPFCAKTYDVHPTGICALSERAEVMNKETYANFAKEIFDIIIHFFYRGYVFEDLGSNFFKNWAVRFDFGPIMIDYPYAYEVDWTKLRCMWVNPFTHQKCDGELDYAYERGMNEIVCTKCGNRYSARHLAKLLPSGAISSIIPIRKGKFTMDDNKFRFRITRGDKTIYQSYTENSQLPNQALNMLNSQILQAAIEETPPPEQTSPVRIITINNPTIAAKQEPKVEAVQPPVKARVITISPNQKVPETTAAPSQPVAPATKPQVSLVQKRAVFKDWSPEVRATLQSFMITVEEKHGRGAAIAVARAVGLYYESPFEKRPKKAKNGIKSVESQVAPPPKVAEVINITSKAPATPPAPVKPEPAITVEKVVSDVDPNRQKTNLFPVQPLSTEELEKREQESRQEDVIMGIVGEPAVVRMKEQVEIPQIKNELIASFNGFVLKTSESETIDFISTHAKEWTKETICKLKNCSAKDITVEVTPTADSRNRKCYLVIIKVLQSPLLDVTIYPKEDQQIQQNTEIKIADGIMVSEELPQPKEEPKLEVDEVIEEEKPLPTSIADIKPQPEPIVAEVINDEEQKELDVIQDFFWDKVEKATVSESMDESSRKMAYISILNVSLMDYKRLPYAKACELAAKFVEENYPFTASAADEV